MAQLQSTAITGSLTASVNISASSAFFSSNVGIGTASPATKLDVNGATTLGSLTVSGATNIATTSAATKIGLGTTSPDVSFKVTISGNSGTTSPGIFFDDQASSPKNYALYTNGNKNFVLRNQTDAIDPWTATPTGNIGICVTPSAWGSSTALQVGSYLSLSSAGAYGGGVGFNAYYNGSNHIYLGNNYASILEQSGGSFRFKTAANGTAGNTISFTQAMEINASGNVQIGSTTEYGRLFVSAPNQPVSGGGVSNVNIFSSDSQAVDRGGSLSLGGNADTLIEFGKISGRKENSTSNNRNGYLQFATFKDGAGLAERMRISSNGDVGIGEAPVTDYRVAIKSADSTATTYALMTRNSSSTNLLLVRSDGYIVTGTASISPYNYTTGAAANLWVGASGELQRSTSSIRYKSNVQDATFGLAEVLALRPVTYRAKNSGDTVFGGLIAEEVDAAGLTPFVAYDTEGRPDAIHYGNMVALLTKAIQEQHTLITALQDEITQLKNNIK